MRCASTNAMKCCGVKRARADLAKCGLAERKFSGAALPLVKLQRPPPEMRIFLPGLSARSRTRTRHPRRPAWMAHMRPAAPAPRMRTSTSVGGGVMGGDCSMVQRRGELMILMIGYQLSTMRCNQDEDRYEGFSGASRGESQTEGLADAREDDVRLEGGVQAGSREAC